MTTRARFPLRDASHSASGHRDRMRRADRRRRAPSRCRARHRSPTAHRHMSRRQLVIPPPARTTRGITSRRLDRETAELGDASSPRVPPGDASPREGIRRGRRGRGRNFRGTRRGHASGFPCASPRPLSKEGRGRRLPGEASLYDEERSSSGGSKRDPCRGPRIFGGPPPLHRRRCAPRCRYRRGLTPVST